MKYFFANWKMYLDYTETAALAEQLLKEKISLARTTLAVFPVSIATASVVKAFEGVKIGVGAQNVAWVPKGAYTGAVSALMYKDIGCQYALVGHSERRYIFNETDEAVRKKFEAALDAGLIPVLCVGETMEDREAGKHEYRIKKQLMKVFEGQNFPDSTFFIVAYEPVWAIGSGNPCDSVEAARMHMIIKQELAKYTSVAAPVLYGGSVDEKNVVSYVSLDPIAGVLVGKSSIHADSLLRMVRLLEENA